MEGVFVLSRRGPSGGRSASLRKKIVCYRMGVMLEVVFYLLFNVCVSISVLQPNGED